VWKETAEGSETLSLKNRIYELLKCFADFLEPKILADLKFVLGKFQTVPLNNEKSLFLPPRGESDQASVPGSFTKNFETTRAKRTAPKAKCAGRTKLDFIK
jgi:hypothetical protein